MNVSLTPQIQKLIREKVDSGMFSNGSEVVREALRLYFERERKRDLFETEILKGLEDVAGGRVHESTDEFWKALLGEARRRAADEAKKAG
jgi:antitoxin ParD1/3/4